MLRVPVFNPKSAGVSFFTTYLTVEYFPFLFLADFVYTPVLYILKCNSISESWEINVDSVCRVSGCE